MLGYNLLRRDFTRQPSTTDSPSFLDGSSMLTSKPYSTLRHAVLEALDVSVGTVDADLHVTIASESGQLVISPRTRQKPLRPAVRIIGRVTRQPRIVRLEELVEESVLFGSVRITMHQAAYMFRELTKCVYEKRRVRVLGPQGSQVIPLDWPAEWIGVRVPWGEPDKVLQMFGFVASCVSPECSRECNVYLPVPVSPKGKPTCSSSHAAYLLKMPDGDSIDRCCESWREWRVKDLLDLCAHL